MVLQRFFERRMPTSYGEQTYNSPYWIVRAPHRIRIETARSAVLGSRPTSLLDYGAGDGEMLFGLIERGLSAKEIVAYEPPGEMCEALRESIENRNLTHRIRVVDDRAELERSNYDFITCLDVMEHMPLLERQSFYDLCDRALHPEGTILIEVPVEVGPALFVKALGRRVLKGRAREYGMLELLRLSLGGSAFDPERYDPGVRTTWIHNHKGFDYRLFRAELSRRFQLVREDRTPIRRLPAPLFNQGIFFQATRHP